MRLSNVLSKDPSKKFWEIEEFLSQKVLKRGLQRKIDIGNIALEFFCEECDSMRTFRSQKASYCMGIDKKLVTVNSLLGCVQCEKNEVLVWFLVEGNEDLHESSPSVRIVKRGVKLFGGVKYGQESYNELSELLYKAETCFFDEMGVGAVIYLRVILERVIYQVADTLEIATKRTNGRYKGFRNILEEVDSMQSIIPPQFREERYKLFEEMSEIVHGRSTEEQALNKFRHLKELVNGILKTVEINQTTSEAIEQLGWQINGGSNGSK